MRCARRGRARAAARPRSRFAWCWGGRRADRTALRRPRHHVRLSRDAARDRERARLRHLAQSRGMPDWPVRHPAGHLAGLARLEPALRRVEASGFRRLLAPLNVAYAEGLVRVGRASARACGSMRRSRAAVRTAHLFVPELLRVTGVAMLEQARPRPRCRARTRPTGIVICRWRSRPRTGRAPRWMRGALDLADHLIERGAPRTRRRWSPASRGTSIRIRARMTCGACCACRISCARTRRRRRPARVRATTPPTRRSRPHSDARVPGSRATARSRHACRCVRRSRVPSA